MTVIAVMYPAEEVGGDFYEFRRSNGGAWIGVGDVTGHGVTSGLIMMMAQSMFTMLCEQSNGHTTPSEFVTLLNRAMFYNLRSRLAQLIGILRRFGFGLGDGLMRVLDGALCPGAARRKCLVQRPLHQKLVSRYQHYKEQNRRDCAEQERTDLLKDFIHVCARLIQADGYFHRG